MESSGNMVAIYKYLNPKLMFICRDYVERTPPHIANPLITCWQAVWNCNNLCSVSEIWAVVPPPFNILSVRCSENLQEIFSFRLPTFRGEQNLDAQGALKHANTEIATASRLIACFNLLECFPSLSSPLSFFVSAYSAPRRGKGFALTLVLSTPCEIGTLTQEARVHSATFASRMSQLLFAFQTQWESRWCYFLQLKHVWSQTLSTCRFRKTKVKTGHRLLECKLFYVTKILWKVGLSYSNGFLRNIFFKSWLILIGLIKQHVPTPPEMSVTL